MDYVSFLYLDLKRQYSSFQELLSDSKDADFSLVFYENWNIRKWCQSMSVVMFLALYDLGDLCSYMVYWCQEIEYYL